MKLLFIGFAAGWIWSIVVLLFGSAIGSFIKRSSPPPPPPFEQPEVYEEQGEYEVANCSPFGAVVFDPEQKSLRLRSLWP